MKESKKHCKHFKLNAFYVHFVKDRRNKKIYNFPLLSLMFPLLQFITHFGYPNRVTKNANEKNAEKISVDWVSIQLNIEFHKHDIDFAFIIYQNFDEILIIVYRFHIQAHSTNKQSTNIQCFSIRFIHFLQENRSEQCNVKVNEQQKWGEIWFIMVSDLNPIEVESLSHRESVSNCHSKMNTKKYFFFFGFILSSSFVP